MGLVKAQALSREPAAVEVRQDISEASEEALNDADPRRRSAAARTLAATAGSETLLLERFRREADQGVRESLLLALIGLGTPAAAAGLAVHLGSDDADVRNAVIEALGTMPAGAAATVEALLGDPDPDIRIFACNILAGLDDPAAEPWLRRVVETETEANVCAAAVEALTQVGTADSVPALRALAIRFPREPFLAFAIDTALAQAEDR